MSDESETGELLVPKHEYDEIVEQLADFKDTADKIIEENRQLKEALKKVDAGIHRASDMAEGLAHTNDQKLITNLAMDLLKHHPKNITIKYKGETILEIKPE
jgi:hypothetical protein